MAKSLEEVTKDALDLLPRQRIALAGFLLESADTAANSSAEAAWETEIHERIRAIDEGQIVGIPYEEVMHAAESRLVP